MSNKVDDVEKHDRRAKSLDRWETHLKNREATLNDKERSLENREKQLPKTTSSSVTIANDFGFGRSRKRLFSGFRVSKRVPGGRGWNGTDENAPASGASCSSPRTAAGRTTQNIGPPCSAHLL